VDEQTCSQCGLCREVCPGIHFGKSLVARLPDYPFAGVVQDAYVGKAADKNFFGNSQSGGIVSALLVHCLETGRIKGAVTVAMPPGTPPRPKVQVAETPDEIYQAQKSKYCPVPLLGFIRKLNNTEGPVAVVGIPCQLHGMINILDKMPKLQNKIAFTIGLVCEKVLTFAALEYLISRAKLDSMRPTGLHFKNKTVSGYPGDVFVFSDDNLRIIPAKTRMQIKDYFTPARCRLCFDKMNVFSDITVGDPHGLQGVDREHGESMLLVRTNKGREVVENARQSNSINIRSIQYEHVLKGQGIDQKIKDWRGYVEAWKQMGYTPPDYYELVKKQTTSPDNLQKYKQEIKYSLRLDRFSSREKLIQRVENALKKKQWVELLSNQLYLPKRVLRKIYHMFWTGKQ
jgi:coenzyme F420 hydrogenase subunit beta